MDATNNTNDSHTYTIVSGVGDDDNAAFSIDGNRLLTTGPLDHEAQKVTMFVSRLGDSAGDKFQQSLHIKTLNVNDPPSDILLDPTSVAENLPEETTVGILTAVDDGGLVEGVGSYEVFSKSTNWASANESARSSWWTSGHHHKPS